MSNAVGIAAAVGATLVHAQASSQKTPCTFARANAVVIYGDSVKRSAFDLEVLRRMPSHEITGADHDGKPARYKGVTIRDLLIASGGAREVRSGGLAQYILAEGRDGYRATLAMAETDTAFHRGAVMAAYEKNGAAMDTLSGPIQLVVEGDGRHGRWVRQLACLRVETAPAK